MSRAGPDKPDRLDPNLNMSGLSGSPWGLLDEKTEKVENNPRNGGDKSDRFGFETNMSGLSLHVPGLLDEKMENTLGAGPDKPDRLDPNLNMSGLSGSPWDLLDEKKEKVENNTRYGGDKSDRFRFQVNMSGLSGSTQDILERTSTPYDEQDFEERLAIAEYDGGQTPLHAHRIAYLDAFISVMNALPATDSQKDWLEKRIQTSLTWIEAPGSPVMLGN
jgi:hypothetical protein